MSHAPQPASLAAAIVRRRVAVGIAWILACALLIPMARSIDSALSVAARIEASESAEVEALLERRFASPLARHVLLVVSGIPAPAEPAGREALGSIVADVRAVSGVSRVVSYLDSDDPLFAGSRGGTFVIVGLAGTSQPEALLASLRAEGTKAATRLRSRFPQAALFWTGEAALNADLRSASAADAEAAERRALPVILALLLLGFGSIAAALLPVVAGMAGIAVSLGLAACLAAIWPLSILLQNIVSLIGLGLGIDYSLLMVSRFREELRSGKSKVDAATSALARTGPTIVMSGAAVAIGFAALATTSVNELRSAAVGGLLVVVVSVLISTTLMPALLATLGPAVGMRRECSRAAGAARWTRWARFVTARPQLVLVVFVVPVAWLALQAWHLRIDLPRGDWLPRAMESAQGLRTLASMDRGSVAYTLRVVLESPQHADVLGAAGWDATLGVARAIAADADVAQVRSLPALVGHPAAAGLVPVDIRNAFVSTDSRLALLEVIPRERMAPSEAQALVRRIRSIDVPATTGLAGTRLSVGGLPAFNEDYQAAVAGRFFQVASLVLSATFVALAIGFRSLLVPLKAIALNLLAVAGAFGALTLVFQDGLGATLLGLEGGLDGVFPFVPVMVFCIVFGLSMDYEVFLIARVREARRAGLGEDAAIAEGLAQTGGLITSAAAIMIAVFAAFTLGELVLIKMLGFTLAVAVFLDATVMRLAVSPALLALAGRWNWWPGERGPRRGSR